MLKNLYIVQ